MRILILCSRVPYPLHDGGNLAVNNLLEGFLEAGVEVSMLAMNTSKHWVSDNELPKYYSKLHQYKTVKVDNRVKPIPAFISFIKGSSYNLKRFITKDYQVVLRQMLEARAFDIILLEGLFVTPYLPTIRKYSSAHICYRQHNVEFQIWERLAQNANNWLKRIYLGQLGAALKKYELRHFNDYDSIAAISPIDADIYRQLGCGTPIIDIPFSLTTNELRHPVSQFKGPLKLYHIGAMDWQPNVEALLWFLRHVWPQVLQAVHGAELYLAGRNMPEQFRSGIWSNVFVLGEVPDAGAFESDKHILIVPLRSGGGLRIKILKAMVNGKAIISTQVGMQGIEAAQHEQEVLLADDADAFAAACIRLLEQMPLAQQLGNNARKLIQDHYSQKVVINKLLQHFKSALQINTLDHQ